ncbi:SRPBCC family protein [Methylomonas sp. SURF-1]|uniref:SRPBCC family protein n=1 Tax=Methylomonas aurea TaxID=2952224 RepID=A0ABT1ULR6_9GAMM|nr:SRPBCC family protein [Methylomonas sp. SURF-1]MCQ8183148.1 SRPBCC family protein [Methylomonas sp. SURF-1]
MLEMILIVAAVALAAFAVMALRQPDTFSVSRTLTMAAPASAVFAQVNDLRKWNAWSPWAKLDPNARNSFEGPDAGVGAVMRWSGNNQVGQGSMTIVDSRPDSFIRFNLEFLKPFKASNVAEFSFESIGAETVVTWTMSGRNNLVGKAMSVVMNCDKMVGGQFEQGLAAIKSIVEAGA